MFPPPNIVSKNIKIKAGNVTLGCHEMNVYTRILSTIIILDSVFKGHCGKLVYFLRKSSKIFFKTAWPIAWKLHRNATPDLICSLGGAVNCLCMFLFYFFHIRAIFVFFS